MENLQKKRDLFHKSTFVKTKQADIQNFLYSLTFSTTFILTPKFNGHVCYINPDIFFWKPYFWKNELRTGKGGRELTCHPWGRLDQTKSIHQLRIFLRPNIYSGFFFSKSRARVEEKLVKKIKNCLNWILVSPIWLLMTSPSIVFNFLSPQIHER